MLTIDGCKARISRFARGLSEMGADLAVLCQPRHVYYFTGVLGTRLIPTATVIGADGRSWTVLGGEPDQTAADHVVTYTADNIGTLRLDQRTHIAAAVRGIVSDNFSGAIRVGVEGTAAYQQLLVALGDRAETLDVDPLLWGMRRSKDPDELALIRKAISLTEAMYAKAREIIAVGANEISVYGRLRQTACEAAGEEVVDFGNDFQCGTPGGKPRDRGARAGELWIFDLGPSYREYFADNCRTFSVDRKPTDAQLAAWECIVAALDHVANTVRPGVCARGLYEDVKAMLDEGYPGLFWHHLGHGIGLNPHEGPQLNPAYDAVFAEGDVFTAEPGLYNDELNGGIRLEENYRVTADGIEKLTAFPLDLA